MGLNKSLVALDLNIHVPDLENEHFGETGSYLPGPGNIRHSIFGLAFLTDILKGYGFCSISFGLKKDDNFILICFDMFLYSRFHNIVMSRPWVFRIFKAHIYVVQQHSNGWLLRKAIAF